MVCVGCFVHWHPAPLRSVQLASKPSGSERVHTSLDVLRIPDIEKSSHEASSGQLAPCHDIGADQQHGLGAAAIRWPLECRGCSREGSLSQNPPLCGRDREWSRPQCRAGEGQRRGWARGKREHPRHHSTQQDARECNRQSVGTFGFRRLVDHWKGELLRTVACRKTPLIQVGNLLRSRAGRADSLPKYLPIRLTGRYRSDRRQPS
jgi:hypothetical protein